MSFSHRITSSFFTALPAMMFFVAVLISPDMRQEYYWTSIFAAVSVLLGSALLLGFLQPARWKQKWSWIVTAGFAAMLPALFVIAVLNATPLCMGQDNGDGINSSGMCMGYVILYAFFYGIPYLLMLAGSAFLVHRAIQAYGN